jgi:hypothetical protein
MRVVDHLALIFVDASVDLHDELSGRAAEIGDVRAYRMLSAEARLTGRATSQPHPKEHFGARQG